MKFSLRARAAFAICCLSLQTPARAQDSVAVAQLAQHASLLRLENGALSGPGADVLRDALGHSQFFLIGESHGFVEVPGLTAALFDLGKPMGYRHLAVEVGPLSARRIQSLAATPSRDSAFAKFQARFPFMLSFYMWQEEQDMARRVVMSMHNAPNVLWGLDQEVMFAPAFLLRDVADSAPAARRQFADSVARHAADLHRQMLAAHNLNAVYMMAASDDDIASARNAMAPPAGSFAASVFEELIASRAIYKDFFGGASWESNDKRAALMKRHFRAYYDRAVASGERIPKVIFKFGANHAMKGREITNTYDLGSLAHEIAVANGSRAFNLLVVVGSGTQNTWLPFAGGDAEKHRPFVPQQDRTGELPGLGVSSLLRAAPDTTEWTLLDFRPLRPLLSARRLGDVSAELERAIWAYDGAVVIPRGHASQLAGDPSR